MNRFTILLVLAVTLSACAKAKFQKVNEPPPAGPVGPAGPQGPQGIQGLMGPQGPRGLQGMPGAPGVCTKGDKGDKGEAGKNGKDGAAGPKGDKGDKGDKGEKGVAGPQGPACSSNVLLTIFTNIPRGCSQIDTDVWVYNEGSTVWFKNNSRCSHGPLPDKVYCQRVSEYFVDGDSTVCWVGRRQYTVMGIGSALTIYELTFN